MKTNLLTVLLVLLSISTLNAQDIALTFANAQITNDGVNDFYEADILISSTADFYVGSGQLYLDYSTTAFGSNISANGNLEYSQPVGSILGFSFGIFSPAYKDFIQNDNTSSRISLSFQQNVGLGGFQTTTDILITTTPKVLLHIKIRYANTSEAPGICFFSTGIFQDQFFTACGGAGIADCAGSPGTQITNDSYDCSGASLSTAYIYNNGWLPSDPNGVSTASDDINVVAGNATISSNTNCNGITVAAGAGLTINNGVTLTTTSGLVLVSTSTSYSSLILDGMLTGTVTYRRHVNQTAITGGNDLISPPVSGQSFTDFLANNPNIASNAGNTLYLFGPFDKTAGTYTTYANTESATLSSGVGYRAATTDNATLRFQGTVNQGTVNQAVLNSGPSFSQWNLIGNPYPSYLNVQDFLNNTNNAGVLDVTNVGIYGYDGNASDGWTIYNLNTINANTVITPGQGFFVAVSSNANIAFTPSMRRHGTTDDFIVGRNTITNQHLRLQLHNTDGNTSSTDFYFNGNSTNGLDPGYDAAVFGNMANTFALYSHLIANGQGVDFAIQSLPEDILSNGMIPLGINANQGEQLIIGIESSNLPQDVDVYLLDNQENTSTHLNTEDFIMTPIGDLSGTGRFYISFSQQTLGISENDLNTLEVFTLNDSDTLVIKGHLQEDTKAALYDINGRLVLRTMLASDSNSNVMSTTGLATGIYMVQLTNNVQGQYVKKVIID